MKSMNGTENVTANYQITYLPGTLKVTPISVELTANSASKEYDGIALTDGGYSVTGGAFIGNDGLAAVTVEGSRTHVDLPGAARRHWSSHCSNGKKKERRGEVNQINNPDT